jgi:SlyX protein
MIARCTKRLAWQKGNVVEEMLVELQTKFSFQEDLLQELNLVVTHQQKQIDDLRREVKRYMEQSAEILASVNHLGGGEQNENPPHY